MVMYVFQRKSLPNCNTSSFLLRSGIRGTSYPVLYPTRRHLSPFSSSSYFTLSFCSNHLLPSFPYLPYPRLPTPSSVPLPAILYSSRLTPSAVLFGDYPTFQSRTPPLFPFHAYPTLHCRTPFSLPLRDFPSLHFRTTLSLPLRASLSLHFRTTLFLPLRAYLLSTSGPLPFSPFVLTLLLTYRTPPSLPLRAFPSFYFWTTYPFLSVLTLLSTSELHCPFLSVLTLLSTCGPSYLFLSVLTLLSTSGLHCPFLSVLTLLSTSGPLCPSPYFTFPSSPDPLLPSTPYLPVSPLLGHPILSSQYFTLPSYPHNSQKRTYSNQFQLGVVYTHSTFSEDSPSNVSECNSFILFPSISL